MLQVWRANMKTRRRNAAQELSRRKQARSLLRQLEADRLQPFIDGYKQSHDGRVDNRVINSSSGMTA